MPQPGQTSALHLIEVPTAHAEDFSHPNPREPHAPVDSTGCEVHRDPLLTADDVARRLNVSKDWVWDHSSGSAPSAGHPDERRDISLPRQPDRGVYQRAGTPLSARKGTSIKWESPRFFRHRTEEPMGKSHQAGWVSLRGKQWFGYFRKRVLDPETNEERVKKICFKLGLKSKMTKLEARDALRAKSRNRPDRTSGAER